MNRKSPDGNTTLTAVEMGHLKERGNRMEKGKWKRAAVYIGVTAAVYLVFKYILPLVTPFIFALLFAAVFRPQVRFLNKKLHMKQGIAAAAVLLFWGGVLGGVIWWLGGMLIAQIRNVIDNYDLYYTYVNDKMCDFCAGIDKGLGLVRGTTLTYLDNGANMVAETAREQLMPSIMGGSLNMVRQGIMFFGVAVIFFMAVFFLTKDYDKLKECAVETAFSEEYSFLYERIGKIVLTFIKTQLIIMGITMVICAAGLFFLKNPYWLLLGVILGLVDALPVFGTGTILMPWAVIQAFSGKYLYGAILALICLVCYLLREYLEPKLMGKQLGAHPLFMLVAVYAGIMLFGIMGVIVGPIAFLLVKEIISYYTCKLTPD